MARRASAAPLPSSRAHGTDGRMPIEELARRTGVTVRNLRALHARTLLPPPELVGRKGFYTERHVARVMLVLKLQSRRFSLASIQSIVESWEAGGGLLDVMGLEDSLLTPGAEGVAGEVDVAAVLPELLRNPRALRKAREQDLVVERDGRFVAPNAELLEILAEHVRAGFPLERLLRDGDLLLADLDRIAARFRQSFFEHVVDPYMASANSGTGLSDVADKVARLRPASVRLVTLLFARAIERGGGPGSGKAPRGPAVHATEGAERRTRVRPGGVRGRTAKRRR